jgi:hypothetical protein
MTAHGRPHVALKRAARTECLHCGVRSTWPGWTGPCTGIVAIEPDTQAARVYYGKRRGRPPKIIVEPA